MKVAVSFLSSNDDYLTCISKINDTNADYIHFDIMDGLFVPNKNMDISELGELISACEKPVDIHLMVNDPIEYIKEIVKYKVDAITIHSELNDSESLDLIKSHGIRCGLAIKPNTKVSYINDYIDYIDLVLIMSVEPGAGGQSFMLSSISKIKELVECKKTFDLDIYIDGGINSDTIKLVKGVDTVISGSYVCKSDNYQERINSLR